MIYTIQVKSYQSALKYAVTEMTLITETPVSVRVVHSFIKSLEHVNNKSEAYGYLELYCRYVSRFASSFDFFIAVESMVVI